MKDDRAYLLHICDCADRVLSYTSNGREAFLSDHMQQDAVLRNLEVIGEAVKNLSDALRDQCPDIQWKQIAGMRDVLIHHYFGVNLETVWNVVESHIPALRDQIARLSRAEDENKNDGPPGGGSSSHL